MTGLFFVLAAASGSPRTALAAERAFAADAQKVGQWTAFRRWAATGAVMFTPQPTDARTFLKPLKDPPRAVRWSPTASWMACDGKWAANTGEWRRSDGTVGFFSTIWHRRSDGRWRWEVDGGDRLAIARPRIARPLVRVAPCGGEGRNNGYGLDFGRSGGSGFGVSDDATLRWRYHVDANGARRFIAEVWNGRSYDRVIDDQAAASPQ